MLRTQKKYPLRRHFSVYIYVTMVFKSLKGVVAFILFGKNIIVFIFTTSNHT